MRVGVICRADNRGLLGIQTYEYFRNLPVNRSLVLIAGVDKTNGRPLSPFAQRPERFDRGEVMQVVWNAGEETPTQRLREFLDGLDVVLTAETFYWSDFPKLARQMGVKTVLQANPEFMSPDLLNGPHAPDRIWLPSSWLADKIPGAIVLPFPVNRAAIPFRPRTEANTFLHVVGRRAILDRNGTQMVYRALRHIKTPMNVLIRSQDPVPATRTHPGVKVEVRIDDIENYADLYSEGDVFVFPRRYGGQALILNEALASGLPVLMTNCPPQNTFLPSSMLLHSVAGPLLRTMIGRIRLHDTHPMTLARRMIQLVHNPGDVKELSIMADKLADRISWDTLRPRYIEEIEQVLNQ